jgi:hypothetical protein
VAYPQFRTSDPKSEQRDQNTHLDSWEISPHSKERELQEAFGLEGAYWNLVMAAHGVAPAKARAATSICSGVGDLIGHPACPGRWGVEGPLG